MYSSSRWPVSGRWSAGSVTGRLVKLCRHGGIGRLGPRCPWNTPRGWGGGQQAISRDLAEMVVWISFVILRCPTKTAKKVAGEARKKPPSCGACRLAVTLTYFDKLCLPTWKALANQSLKTDFPPGSHMIGQVLAGPRPDAMSDTSNSLMAGTGYRLDHVVWLHLTTYIVLVNIT